MSAHKISKKHLRKVDSFAVKNASSHKDIHEQLDQFSVAKGWENLFALPTCVHILLMPEQQEKMKVVVAKNVTQEYPWREVPFADFREHYIYGSEKEKDLLAAFQGYGDNNPVLLGYVPQVTQHLDVQPDGDPFICFVSSNDVVQAMNYIKEIEAFEYLYYRRNLTRRPKPWVSLGSEKEVNFLVEPPFTSTETIEVQSVYPVIFTGSRALGFRMTHEVRDGYVELVPSESAKFDNVMRKRLSLAIQKSERKITVEVQTTPTFPINAASQSDSTIEIDDDTVDKSDSEEDRERGKAVDPNREKKPLVMSRQMKLLLEVLDFSTVNFYRNDYVDLTERTLQSTAEPEFEELICFANIEKTYNRYICAANWYPNISGLMVLSYAFGTLTTQKSSSEIVNQVRRAVLDPNPVLLWSFSDNLNFKMEFSASSEVTSLSFCPYDSSILIGGFKNGQVCIWDLGNRIENMDQEEYLTAAQMNYRRKISEFLKDIIIINEDSTVPIACVSELDYSHDGPVTGIYFLGPQWYVNPYGKFYKDEKKGLHKAFITCSFDGGLFFWDLTQLKPKKMVDGRIKHLPKALSQSESKYRKLIFKPLYRVTFKEPICAVSADTAVIKYALDETFGNQVGENRDRLNNYATKPIVKAPKEMRQSAVLATFYGHLERMHWTGILSDESKELVTNSQNFSRIHDGPILTVKKSPFWPEIFISVGRTIFALWKDDFSYSPIMARKRKHDLTGVTWSTDRPAVFFISRGDGHVEVWDILTRDDSPCLEAPIGGGNLTLIAEHGPKTPDKLLAIGDYNSSCRMVKLPEEYINPFPNEIDELRAFILKEEARKRFIISWEEKYYMANKVIIDAKRRAQAEAQKEMDRLEKMQEIVKIEDEPEEAKDDKDDEKKDGDKEEGKGGGGKEGGKQAEKGDTEKEGKKAIPYPQRMAQAWEELNRKRVLQTLLNRMQMDSERLKVETAMEKERLAYEAAKKAAHEELMKNILTVVEQLRSCLLPEEVIDTTHLDLIKKATNTILESAPSYDEVSDDCREIINLFGDFGTCDLNEFLERGKQRRRLINKSLGSNTEREYWYTQLKQQGNLEMGVWGYQYFTRHLEKGEGEEGSLESDHYDLFGRSSSSAEEVSEEDEQRDPMREYMDPVINANFE